MFEAFSQMLESGYQHGFDSILEPTLKFFFSERQQECLIEVNQQMVVKILLSPILLVPMVRQGSQVAAESWYITLYLKELNYLNYTFL